MALALLLPAMALGIYDRERFDLNRWSCPFYNDGRWGIDSTGQWADGSWPRPLHNCYVFGAGPWVGSIVGTDTLVTFGYDPNSSGTEYRPILCRHWRQGAADSADRVYKCPGDWPPPQSRFPMAPQQARSEMDLWCCYGDSDPSFHTARWPVNGVAVAGNFAYVVGGPLGLRIIDISNPFNPVVAGSCDMPGSQYDVAIAGDYAYAADFDSGLRVINVTNPQSPYEAGHYHPPGYANGVAVAGSQAYVTDWFSLRIVDVSNPQSPCEVGHYDTPRFALGVAVVGDYAYVVCSDSGLRIIDVSNPQSPCEVGHCNTPRLALGVAVADDYAYVVCSDSGLRIIDVSNPQSPYEVGHCYAPRFALGVAVMGGYACMVNGGYGLRIINIANPQSPYEVGYYDTPGSAEGVAVASSYAYVADGSCGLRIIGVSNPQNPYELGHYGIDVRPLGVDVYLTVCGFADSLAQDCFFLKYELANCSGSLLPRTYFGLLLDADVGDPTDDMTGLILNRVFQIGPDTIRVRNTGFAFDYNNVEYPGQSWESGTPGAVAVMLLSAPESLGLTAFKRLTLGADPETNQDQYLTLAGYDYGTRVYSPYDSVDAAPDDKRALMATGPFDLAPGGVATFWYAIIGSPYGDSGQGPQGRDTAELVLRCRRARDCFQRLIGITEEPAIPGGVPRVATLVRGVLRIGSQITAHSLPPEIGLLDAAGRQVMKLKPGENDVSGLAAGVYFVRDQGSGGGGQGEIRKVVIQR